MATYLELLSAESTVDLRLRVRVACLVAAESIRTEAGATPNHANRLLWAKATFANPVDAGEKMIWAVLAANKAATLAAITGASDATVQTAVDAAVDVFAT